MLPAPFRLRWRRRLRRAGALLLLVVLMIGAWTSLPASLSDVSLIHVIDGDSLKIRHDGAVLDIRLRGIDAVEYRQDCGEPRDERRWACGREARGTLERLSGRGPLRCDLGAKDRYGRTLATCRSAPAPEGVDLNAEMVRRGFAVASGDDYLMEQAEARAARRGIWQGDFTPPAEWRVVHERASDTAIAPDA